MPSSKRLLALLLPAILLAACGTTPTLPPPPTPTPVLVLTVGAVSGVQPHLAEWIAVYQDNHPGVALEVLPDTLTRVQDSVARGTADIALLDQEPLPYYYGVLTATQVAEEELAVVVHPRNALSSISSVALIEVLAGRVADWGAVGGEAGPLQLYLLPDSSGEVQFLARTALVGRRLAPQAVVCASATSLLRAVADDPSGIGILPSSAVVSQVAVLRVDDLLPGDEGYPWQMPLFLAYGPASPRQARDFCEYIGRLGE